MISYVLHDIPRSVRALIVGVLARKLAISGSNVIREPMRLVHGMPVEEIQSLIAANGLTETSAEDGRGEFSARDRKEGPGMKTSPFFKMYTSKPFIN